jgi:hypothetical protein
MKNPSTEGAVQPAQSSRIEYGYDRFPTRVHPSGRINFLRTRQYRTLSRGVRQLT